MRLCKEPPTYPVDCFGLSRKKRPILCKFQRWLLLHPNSLKFSLQGWSCEHAMKRSEVDNTNQTSLREVREGVLVLHIPVAKTNHLETCLFRHTQFRTRCQIRKRKCMAPSLPNPGYGERDLIGSSFINERRSTWLFVTRRRGWLALYQSINEETPFHENIEWSELLRTTSSPWSALSTRLMIPTTAIPMEIYRKEQKGEKWRQTSFFGLKSAIHWTGLLCTGLHLF